MHDSAKNDGPPAAGDRSGRRPLVERRKLRSVLERSTGIGQQALGHLPGLVIAVLDLDGIVLELTSTVSGMEPEFVASLHNRPFAAGLSQADAGEVQEALVHAALGESTTWRFTEPHTGHVFEADGAPIRDAFTDSVVGIVVVARDISDKAAAEHDRDAILQSFQDSFALAPIPQLLLDEAGCVRAANGAFAELVGRDEASVVGAPFAELILPRDAGSIERAVRLTHAGDASPRQSTGARVMREDGESVHCRLHLLGFDDDATGARTIVQLIDQTERDRYEAELRSVANHDSLTGLLNRRGFRERVGDSLSTGRRRNEARTLLIVDIDHFKQVNDLHGHAVGDAMLRDVAEQITRTIGPRDAAARIAGDEFAVLCVDGATSARATAAALLETVRRHSVDAREHGRLPLTLSIGLAEVDPVMDTVDDVLLRADMALYEAKAWGRDCVVEASAIVGKDAAQRSDRILSALRAAIASERGLALHAQPILDLRTGRVTQHEMLARLTAEDGTMLSPADFLPLAERHGLLPELDAWVARRSVALLGAQRAQDRPLPKLHVNMSARSLDHPELLHELAGEIDRHRLPAGHLVVELTETSKLIDLDVAMRFARELGSLGCELALDDFGAGFNSLVHLRELPLDYVKIDGSLTRGVATDDRAATLVEGLAATARGLGVRTVAEFVDSAAMQDRVEALGVDLAQGFHIGVPAALPTTTRTRRHVATPGAGPALLEESLEGLALRA